MQGYILNIYNLKNEDLIVNILTKNEFSSFYRFYGARHSTINLGYKIDFNSETNVNSNLKYLRNISHLSFNWLNDINKMSSWQKFIKLLYLHIKDIDIIDTSYFDELNTCAHNLESLNYKRAIILSYINILSFEGRYNIDNEKCIICDQLIPTNQYYITRSFIPTHKTCSKDNLKIDYIKLKNMFISKRSIEFNDKEISDIYNIVNLGF